MQDPTLPCGIIFAQKEGGMNQGDEIFDVVNEEGRVVGQASRARCHGDRGLIHQAVHVFVVDPSGRIYLQKRAGGKDIQPGRWDTSVGGHLAPGESYEEGAAREMLEELGLKGALRFLYRYLWRTARETELVQTYLLETGEAPDPDPGEIEEGRFFTLDEIESRLSGEDFTPNLREEIGRLRSAGILPA
jgi:isopentenyldiphosphate isomerase